MAGAATIAMLETETMAHSRFSFQTDRCQQQQLKMCSNEMISVVLAIESVIQVHEKQRLIENQTGK